MLSEAKFLISKSKVLSSYKDMTKIADIVSYSYKTNKEIGTILLQETSCCFSIHSQSSYIELDSPNRIWYFGQAWDMEEINTLITGGVTKFVVDNESDLGRLLEFLRTSNKKVELLLRMKLKEHTIHTGKHFVYGLSSMSINNLIPLLSKNPSIINLGLHFHRKTQNISEWSIKDELLQSILPNNWQYLSYVNIGGGIPVRYKNYSVNNYPVIIEKISELKGWLNNKNVKMIIEPGRYISAYPVKLETNIRAIYDNNIIIDCSVYNSAMDTFVANIRLEVEGEQNFGEAYTIKGCTPDSMDIFRYKVYLKKPKVGDKIIFLNAGAYNYSSDFCNLKKLPSIILD